MQENAHLNVTRLEHKDKTEELEKANTKLLEKIQGEPEFSKHVQQFHRALNEHYRKGGKHLYDPAEMETFSNKHAPGLFAQLYKSILNDDKEKPSKKHMEMQKTRVVSLLHNLSCMATRIESLWSLLKTTSILYMLSTIPKVL
ncbi:uncharacterized protein LOC122950831 [Acropora millepora]|uniref:uncharacterized protein LOC122950831 n=1 Tax=Acropora millepora TaxID=45264 RepID=UPI001CF37ED4|nr:uncharacterized protein LOC122950831 [Acropora millepora]